MDVKRAWRQRESRGLCAEIAGTLPGRNVLSITRYLVKRYPVEKVPWTWTVEDDAHLRKLVATRGPQWTVIAGEMCHSPELIRLRYRDYVSLGQKRARGVWSEDETRKLYGIVLELLGETGWREDEGLDLTVVKKYIDWRTVSGKMESRNRLQCRKKWEGFPQWKDLVEEE